MSKEEKQIQRLKDFPSDYTYTEAKALAKRLMLCLINIFRYFGISITVSGNAATQAYDKTKTIEKCIKKYYQGDYTEEDLAYTFYLKNETGETRDYQYQLNLKKSTKGSEKAAWIMVYKNNEMNLYAMKNSDGTPEKIYSYSEYPFLEYTADEGEYIKEAEDGRYELTARPFISKTAVCTGYREGIKDEEVDKYTVVIWIEGDDPDCTDDIIGGTIEFGMTFNY